MMWTDSIHIGEHRFDTLVALSAEEQARGLMERPWPPPVMCFPSKRAEHRKFWMKNTPSPLDIIFARNNRVIGIYKGEPMSTISVGPNEPSDLVIELPYGTAQKLGISVGDDVKLCYSVNTLAKCLKLSAS